MTFAPGDPQFWPWPIVGQPGVVYSRPTWPHLPPGVPYVPTRYMDAASYGVPVPPGIPPLLIAAANGLGAVAADPRYDTLYQSADCTRIGGRCRDTRIRGSVPAGYEMRFDLCPDTQGGYAQCIVPLGASRPSGTRDRGTTPPAPTDKRGRRVPLPGGGYESQTETPPAGETPADETRSATPGLRVFEGLPSWAPYAMVIGGLTVIGGILYLIGKVGNKPKRRRNAGWRQGARVQYTPSPIDYYIDVSAAKGRAHPQRGDTGTVRAIPLGRGLRTTLPGPGGGLVYVDWDTTGIQGVSPGSLTRISAPRRRNWKEVGARSR